MDSKEIVIVPVTHWDREWYVTFNEYRAYLIFLMDKLIEILKKDPSFKVFTLDGQTIILEDYLEVRPKNRVILKEFVTENRLSIGPFYVLPDEFLISGESMIRNLILGHKIARKFGNVMKVGYIPDPFAHIAQLPQILSGFEISSAIFARGFGNEFEENKLNMEFIWNAPALASSVLAIHLIGGYFSASELDNSKRNGIYKKALRKLDKTISNFENYTVSNVILLNNGSDHLFAQPETPEIVSQWNIKNPEKKMEIGDFADYITKVQKFNPKLNSYEGELRGSKYMPALSGVLSTRMWIKQRNIEIENLYEKYVEPLSTITWILDKYQKFVYPQAYILTGLKWLIKNHPHDSICGCSIDQVHEEMRTRFDWSQQIGEEIILNSIIYLNDLIKMEICEIKSHKLLIFNPLPWNRSEIIYCDVISNNKEDNEPKLENIKLINQKGENIKFFSRIISEEARYQQEGNSTHRIFFKAEIPPLGFSLYKIIPSRDGIVLNLIQESKSQDSKIENEFYILKVNNKGIISVEDKDLNIKFENICCFEDIGDWGDEYDFSGPIKERIDTKITTLSAVKVSLEKIFDNNLKKTIRINYLFKIPSALSEDREKRRAETITTQIELYVSIFSQKKRIDFEITLNNKSKDHRLRVLFPSKIKSKKVFADGHFYIVPRKVALPNDEGWPQKACGTSHQRNFVCVNNEEYIFSVMNRGLPEYEAIKNQDDSITFAITLLRCVGWLSRADLDSRKVNVGPDFATPGAQCLGVHTFKLSLYTDKINGSILDSNIHKVAQEYIYPLMVITPESANTPLRLKNKIILSSKIIRQYFKNPHKSEIEPFLPPTLSLLEIDNNKILLSILKKSENNSYLILRVYNLSQNEEIGLIKFNDLIKISDVDIVNFLEEEPVNKIYASTKLINDNSIELNIGAHVIATIKIHFKS